jgi:hypothetical protein
MVRITDSEAIGRMGFLSHMSYLNIYDNFFSHITLIGDGSIDKDEDSAFAGGDVEKGFPVVVGKLAA